MAPAAMSKKIGLFFGSFNPVHVGHMIIANFMATQADLDQVWLVVSPQNPLKNKSSLARDHDRLHLVRLAIGDNPNLRASDIEFGLPKPSYTIDTLTYLKEKYPDYRFVLIMGGDTSPAVFLPYIIHIRIVFYASFTLKYAKSFLVACDISCPFTP